MSTRTHRYRIAGALLFASQLAFCWSHAEPGRAWLGLAVHGCGPQGRYLRGYWEGGGRNGALVSEGRRARRGGPSSPVRLVTPQQGAMKTLSPHESRARPPHPLPEEEDGEGRQVIFHSNLNFNAYPTLSGRR